METPKLGGLPSDSPSDSRAWGATPASWAMYASRSRWKYLPHLHKLNEKLLDLATGRLRRAVVSYPPRWGKSELCSRHLPGWFMGVKPGGRVILASHTESLAEAWALKCRNDFAEFGPSVFGAAVSTDSARAGSWSTTKGSSIYAVGVGGAVVGRGADLLIVDDPIPSMEAAESESGRAKLLDWFYSEALSRLQQDGVALLIGTRWRVNDLIGSVLESGNWEHLLLPALDGVTFESTAPELFSTAELLARKATLPAHIWCGMYQCEPFQRGGGTFDVTRIKHYTTPPENPLLVRSWDLAGSIHGDYTAGILLGKIADGSYVVYDVQRFRLSPGARDEKILMTAKTDGPRVPILLEIEPGAAGLAEHESLKKFLAGFRVLGEKPLGSKENRANPCAGACWASRLGVVEAGWTRDFLTEMESFPSGAHDDMVDGLAMGYNWLSGRAVYAGPVSEGHYRSKYTPAQLFAMGIMPETGFPGDSPPKTAYGVGSPWDAIRTANPFSGPRGSRRMGP